MTDPEQDEVFEAYLKRQPVLPALDDEIEPPATLDRSVLNLAREAIQTQPATQSAPQRPPRWVLPMALAATLLLCLSVVMNISLNTNHPSPNIARMTAARADVKTSALANATAESDAASGVNAPSPARDAFAENHGERRESVSGDIPSHEVVLPRAKVAGTPAPHAPVVAEAAAPPSASGTLTAPSDAKAPPALASADTPPQLKRSLAETSAPAAPPALDSARSASHAIGAMASANSAAPVAPAESGGSANVSGGASATPATKSAADKAVLMAKEAGVAAPQYTPAPEQERAAASARKAAKAEAGAPHPADPKVWLQQIDALRAAGKTGQADAEMRRFKAVFPDYGAPTASPLQ